jgi:formylglycine-generating enzyme required for sulfatase activity/energy-coupling factor transporter ATP-binding protein EcfA2
MPKKIYNVTNPMSQRDQVFGDQYNLLIDRMGAFVPPPDLVQLRQGYLTHLQQAYHALDFKGIPQLRTLSSELLLEEVYVPLLARPELPEGETWERRLAGRTFDRAALPDEALASLGKMGSSAPVQIEEALREKSRLVVLGDPGSGKSTMLKHLALRMAKDTRAPLPILLPLNAFARALAQRRLNLQTYFAEYFASRAQGVAALGPLIEQAIERGKAVILLDGLDEVQSERSALVQKVEDFAAEATVKGNKVVVTSRIVGYLDAPLPKAWNHYTLLDFDDKAIEDFAQKWCLAFEKSTLGATPEAEASAEIERQGLMDAIHANTGVSRLASNPLLLTILALIKRQGVELPRSRVKLYDRYLETLIEAWNRASALDKTAGRESLDYEATLEVLGPLALRLRQENPTAGLVAEHELLRWICEHFTGEQWGLKPGPAGEKAREFLNSVRRFSNLLVERGEGQYGFIHLTFEEALAAYGLVAAGQVDRAKSLAYIKKNLTDPAWRETILLAVGVLGLLHRQPLAAGEVVRAMLAMPCESENACQNVLMAGASLEDVRETGMGRAAAGEVQEALLNVCHNRSLPPATQRDAGFSLARTGWTPKDLDEFIPIPAGPFLYGDNKNKVVIEKPYEISKYPVTNLQISAFIKAGGYENREYWSAEGWSWRTGKWDTKAPDYLKDWLKGRPAEKRNEPFFWHDSRWNNPLAPVVGVSWFETEAYCNWLSKMKGKRYRLPTEQEWERAARGIDGREYPWGNEFDHTRLNCAEDWAGKDDLDLGKWYEQKGYENASTTIIGQFPEGEGPEHIQEMSGNVWEWTNSWFEEQQVNREVRGGSWDLNRNVARCAVRSWVEPEVFNYNLGFRLVLSPS